MCAKFRIKHVRLLKSGANRYNPGKISRKPPTQLGLLQRGATLSDFHFDQTKSFDANIQMFIDHMVSVDKTMGPILASHALDLKHAIDETKRRSARTNFNKAVGYDLDKLTEKE